MNGLDFHNCKKMIILLDNCEGVGNLFDVIFDIAKKHIELKYFKRGIRTTILKGAFINSIINMTGNNGLIELKSLNDNIRKFKIR